MDVGFDEIVDTIQKATEIVRNWPNILAVEAPCTVIADIHGDGNALWCLLENARCKENVVFMGDVCDRGMYSVDCLYMVLNKVIDGTGVYLRGNHEDIDMANAYGLGEEVRSKFGERGEIVLGLIDDLFRCLPLAAVCAGWFIVHGGVAEFTDLDNVQGKNRFVSRIGEDMDIEALLWSDPGTVDGYNHVREAGYTYTNDTLSKIMDKNGLIGMIRGHQVFEDGYNIVFFDPPCVSISSSFVVSCDEHAAYVELLGDGMIKIVQMTIDENNLISFKVLEPS